MQTIKLKSANGLSTKKSFANSSMDSIKHKEKKVLCIKIVHGNVCQYGDKCMYAHSLAEQKIDPMRHKVYTILKNKHDLTNLDIINDTKLFNTMMSLTKVCIQCTKRMCPGGYNCRHGAISQKYRICYDDLIFGNCKRNFCNSVHLTDRGLVPYTEQKKKYVKSYLMTRSKSSTNWNNPPKTIYMSSVSAPNLKRLPIVRKKQKRKNILTEIPGILLTEKFLKARFDQNAHSSESDTSDDDVEEFIKYLNNSEDIYTDYLEESIFEV